MWHGEGRPQRDGLPDNKPTRRPRHIVNNLNSMTPSSMNVRLTDPRWWFLFNSFTEEEKDSAWNLDKKEYRLVSCTISISKCGPLSFGKKNQRHAWSSSKSTRSPAACCFSKLLKQHAAGERVDLLDDYDFPARTISETGMHDLHKRNVFLFCWVMPFFSWIWRSFIFSFKWEAHFC